MKVNNRSINATDTKLNLPLMKKHNWTVHAVAWLLFFAFPFIFRSRNSDAVSWNDYLRFAVMMLSTMFIFYFNYSYLIRKYLYTGRTVCFTLINLVVVLGVSLVVHLIMESLPMLHHAKPPHMRPDENPELKFYLSNVGRLAMTAIVSLAIKSTALWQEVENERRELAKTNSEAELQNLKNQLNPHFLFNTLNNIYSLIAFSPEKAQEAVHDLSRLLRYVMYDSSNSMVSIDKEIDFVRNYVELMRIRLPEQVDVKTNISCQTPNGGIAPLLFISLIENAFKHGVSNSQPSFIHLDIHQNDQQIVCYIVNSYFPKNNETDRSGSGIGLSNLKKRLELLYPGQYIFECGKEGDTYRSYLSIDLYTPTK